MAVGAEGGHSPAQGAEARALQALPTSRGGGPHGQVGEAQQVCRTAGEWRAASPHQDPPLTGPGSRSLAGLADRIFRVLFPSDRRLRAETAQGGAGEH